MPFNLVSTHLASSIGARAAFPAAIRLATHQNLPKRNMTTVILGRKIEKRFLYTVLAVLGTAEGYFYYSTYYNAKRSSDSAQKSDVEHNSADSD
ncbi:hypothetical protein BCR42DRAFT_178260 [Absidia repens]|uniref:Uncharacterized protein n=1 Tax=Absidia repens TaxID=90262 RepID=A0A1X2HZ37_9FUNG|nr:hypothetical protein BCR42DRAFT_178260 [Absidia repens]